MLRSITLRFVCLAACTAAGLFLPASNAHASNETMLRLLRILRDRGSITAEEYDELRVLAEAPETSAPPVSGPASLATTAVPVKTPESTAQAPTPTEQAISGRLQAVEAQLAEQDPEVAVKKALSNKR